MWNKLYLSPCGIGLKTIPAQLKLELGLSLTILVLSLELKLKTDRVFDAHVVCILNILIDQSFKFSSDNISMPCVSV